MKPVLVSVFFLLCVTYSNGQIKGKVIDSKTNDPITGATVSGTETTVTDKNGQFSVGNSPRITVSCIGYETAVIVPGKGFITVLLNQQRIPKTDSNRVDKLR